MLNAREVPSSKGGDFIRQEPLNPGAYPARLVQIIVLGVQEQRPFKGEEKSPKLEIALTYELLDEFMKDEEGNEIEDKPRWITERMPFNNLDTELAKSTKRYFALDPDEDHGGDWGSLLGVPCMVTIVVDKWKDKSTNEDRFREKVANISAMRPKEAAKAPELVNPARIFDFYSPDMEVWEALPQWLRDVMKAAVDFEGGALEEALEGRPESSQKASEPKEEKKGRKPVRALDNVPNNEGENGTEEDW